MREEDEDAKKVLESKPLPENGGNVGVIEIFKAPVRAAVHPGRPPCLELRPHPLRETQAGRFLRNIVCTDSQLWAGQENGVRFWWFEEGFEPGCGIGGRVRRGDEDAAPFREFANTPPTMSLMVDPGGGLIWSGHKDGRIRSWKASPELDGDGGAAIREGLSWQAHRGPVLAMITSSYGDIWSSSEGGSIKVWPCETIEKCLSLSAEEKHMAALLVERSVIDLRSQVTVNGACNLSSSEVNCLLSDNVRANVWGAQPMSFSLWHARTRRLLRVFNIDGQVENRVDLAIGQAHSQLAVEDEMKVKFVSTSKKEKPHGFLQRSRNAIMGAADAVRRVATWGAGAFVEDTKRTEALVLAADGMIWSGCTSGLLIKWDGRGNRLQDLMHHSSAVQCFCSIGMRIYVGYASGIIQMLDLEGKLVAGWAAHSSPVLKLAAGNGYVFSLGAHGGIRGWNVTSPSPIDNVIRAELAEREDVYTRHNGFRILVATWNVGQEKEPKDSFKSSLCSAASSADIVVVGLQELDMRPFFLAVSAAKETMGFELSPTGKLWLDAIGTALGEGKTFDLMGSRGLAGLLVSLWVTKNLRANVGDLDVAAVPCGLGHALGNKGGVGLRIRVYDRILCFVNCHLAAHLEATRDRNADFDHIYRTMVFAKPSSNISCACVPTTTMHSQKSTNAMGLEEARPDLSEADMVVFLGDLNYRLSGITFDEARDSISHGNLEWLRQMDQLSREMMLGNVFQGMREADIKFPPTYKFERNRLGHTVAGYDSGEKKRIPAWCDRIIYRDCQSPSQSQCSLKCPIVSSITEYNSCMDVIESDHKPVHCKFQVQVAHVDRSARRQVFGRVLRSNEKVTSFLKESRCVPKTAISPERILLQNRGSTFLKIANKSATDKAIFRVRCRGKSSSSADWDDGQPSGSFGFPRWLEVTPALGIIDTDGFAEIMISHKEFHVPEELPDGVPPNWWSEDTRDKEASLVVAVRGSCSTVDAVSHRVNVSLTFSDKPVPLGLGPKSVSSQGGARVGSSNRRDLRPSSASSVDDFGSSGKHNRVL